MERTKAATVKLQYLKNYLCCHKKDKQNQAPYQKLPVTFMLWYCVQYRFFFFFGIFCVALSIFDLQNELKRFYSPVLGAELKIDMASFPSGTGVE